MDEIRKTKIETTLILADMIEKMPESTSPKLVAAVLRLSIKAVKEIDAEGIQNPTLKDVKSKMIKVLKDELEP